MNVTSISSKKKTANLSLNTLLSLNLLIVIILATMTSYSNLIRYKLSNYVLIKNDYLAEIAPSCAHINYLYSIKYVYEHTNSASEFEIYFATIEKKGHQQVFDQAFYKDKRVTIRPVSKNSAVKISKPSIEFSITTVYRDKLSNKYTNKIETITNKHVSQRFICKKCQIINPYIKYNITDTESKRELSNEEIKSLFRFI